MERETCVRDGYHVFIPFLYYAVKMAYEIYRTPGSSALYQNADRDCVPPETAYHAACKMCAVDTFGHD